MLKDREGQISKKQLDRQDCGFKWLWFKMRPSEVKQGNITRLDVVLTEL